MNCPYCLLNHLDVIPLEFGTLFPPGADAYLAAHCDCCGATYRLKIVDQPGDSSHTLP